jgi:hypothetical protein
MMEVGRPRFIVCADAVTGRSVPGNAESVATAESSVRRLSPEKKRLGDMAGSFVDRSVGQIIQ